MSADLKGAMMGNQKEEWSDISPQVGEEKKKESTELSEGELNKISGGKDGRVELQEIRIQKYFDKATP